MKSIFSEMFMVFCLILHGYVVSNISSIKFMRDQVTDTSFCDVNCFIVQ